MKYEMELKTKIKFGIGIVKNLGEILKEHKVKKILLVYGKGSIKKNGLYEEIIHQLNLANITFIEYSGVKPNPRLNHINDGGLKARANNCDAILAVGGGSVIDAAKVMGALATNVDKMNAWEMWTQKQVKQDSLPIFAFITLAATGSENNGNAVVTNEETNQKFAGSHPSCIPLVCFEDPQITAYVDKWNTMCGIFDIFTHALEAYLSLELCDWTRFYLAAQMKTVIKNSYEIIKNPQNIKARSNILITSSMALNSIATFGGATGDWTTHQLEHAVSAIYDVAHGAGLALILPYYLNYGCNSNKVFAERITQLGKDVFNLNSWKDTINKITSWIKELELPLKMQEFPWTSKPIDKEKDINLLIDHFYKRMINDNLKAVGSIQKTGKEEALKIFKELY